ncbi:MAG: hypothetical protein Q9223_004843 [Gallowayella weberi]
MHILKSILFSITLAHTIRAIPAPTPIASSAEVPSAVQHEARTLPTVIYPNNAPPPPQLPGSTLIQLAFKPSYNWTYVASNTGAQTTIFIFLPKGLTDGLSISQQPFVHMQALRSGGSSGQITLALAYIPDDKVELLHVMLPMASSPINNNPDPIVRMLFRNIEPFSLIVAPRYPVP